MDMMTTNNKITTVPDIGQIESIYLLSGETSFANPLNCIPEDNDYDRGALLLEAYPYDVPSSFDVTIIASDRKITITDARVALVRGRYIDFTVEGTITVSSLIVPNLDFKCRRGFFTRVRDLLKGRKWYGQKKQDS